ncbi:MAG: hypothetical protein ACXAEU_21560 [Candidatus Hodarchaeales archaeon]
MPDKDNKEIARGNIPEDAVDMDPTKKSPRLSQNQYQKWLYAQRKKLLEIDRKLGQQIRKRETLAIKDSRNIVDLVNEGLSDDYDPVMLGLDSSIVNRLVNNLGTIYEEIGKATMLDLDVVESFDDDLITVIARLTRQKRCYSCPVLINQAKLNFNTIDFDSPTNQFQTPSTTMQFYQDNLDVVKPSFIKVEVPRKKMSPNEKMSIIEEILELARDQKILTMRELRNLPYEIKSTLFKLAKLKKITLTSVTTDRGREMVKVKLYLKEKKTYREQAVLY